MIREVKFESQERRIKQVIAALNDITFTVHKTVTEEQIIQVWMRKVLK